MSEKPTLFLSNFASARTKGHHGPGRLFSIMAKTPYWAPSQGRVAVLVPSESDLWPAKRGEISMEVYQQRFMMSMQARAELLSPSKLIVESKQPLETFEVRDGDTLCCTCSRGAAAKGECHRVWAAEALLGAGWDVILDGKRLS